MKSLYHRAEVIGAMSSVILIWMLTLWLLYKVLDRIIKNHFKIEIVQTNDDNLNTDLKK